MNANELMRTCIHFRDWSVDMRRDVEMSVHVKSVNELLLIKGNIEVVGRQVGSHLTNPIIRDQLLNMDSIVTITGQTGRDAMLDAKANGCGIALGVTMLNIAVATHLIDRRLSHFDPPSMDMPDLPENNTTTKDGDSDGDSGQTDDA